MFFRFDCPDDSALWAKDDPHCSNNIFFNCKSFPKEHRWRKRRVDLHFVLPPPDKMRDIVWSWHFECLVQEQVVAAFRDAHLTGFDLTPVTARYENPSEVPPVLWRLRAIGWGGVAPIESGVRLLWKCDVCKGMKYSGYTNEASLLDQDGWDGSDFFTVWPYPSIFVSERAAELLKTHRFRGFKLRAPDSTPSLTTASPGTLSISEYLPEPRARQIGEPLGIWWPHETDTQCR
jgi:hypothetical protein